MKSSSDQRGAAGKKNSKYGNKSADKRPFRRNDNEQTNETEKKFFKKRPVNEAGDMPYDKKPFGKPSFRRNDGEQTGEQGKKYEKRRSDNSAPYEKKTFGKRSFNKSDRAQTGEEGKKFEKRRPDGDAPYEKKSYGKRPVRRTDGEHSGERINKFEKRRPEGEGGGAPYEKKSFGKRPFNRNDGEQTGEERKKFEKRRPAGFASRRPDGDAGTAHATGEEKHDRPRRDYNNDGGSSSGHFAGKGKDKKEPREKKNFDRKPFDKARPRRERDDKNEPGNDGGALKPKDTRPFRKRTAPGDSKERKFDRNKQVGEPENADKKEPGFDDVLKNAFHGAEKKEEDSTILKPQQFEDKVYAELADPNTENRPKPAYEKKLKIKKDEPVAAEKVETGKRRRRKAEEEEEEDEEIVKDESGLMPLNKYIAHCGECSRRDAAEMVKQGKVKVNGELVTDPGHKVTHDDQVTMGGKKLTLTSGYVYVLLNKPKDYITTNDDPQGRRTVMELLQGVEGDRLYPVGRLDRETSGLLLITNDGDLTQKLCHPSFDIKKVYHVILDKSLTKADFEKIAEGVELEDGMAKVDEIAFLENKNEIGLEIHSGRNRIVRRIFEALGYEVTKLDRVMYAGLTKKNLPRGKWRYLNPREVVLLKHFKSL